jgi:hypothetical protein
MKSLNSQKKRVSQSRKKQKKLKNKAYNLFIFAVAALYIAYLFYQTFFTVKNL